MHIVSEEARILILHLCEGCWHIKAADVSSALWVGCDFCGSCYSKEMLGIVQVVCRVVADCFEVSIVGVRLARGNCKSGVLELSVACSILILMAGDGFSSVRYNESELLCLL